ncbi:MAG: HEAT repeat domain-containing protein [Caldilineaceae bacterium]|nr:HEAT repeat domain-containing protein [Caldilineaceae bacterium]
MTKPFRTQVEEVIQRLHPDARQQGQQDVAAIYQSGATTLAQWLAVLRDPAAALPLRRKICWMLGRIGNRRAYAALLSALADPAPSLRSEAAHALGMLADPRALPALIERLHQDPEADVRLMAAYGLGLLGDPNAVAPLIATLEKQEETAKVRGMAAETLGGLYQPTAVAPLIAALQDAAAEVRYWAAFALGELGDERAIPPLEALAARDTTVLPQWGSIRQEALAALEAIRRAK